MIDKSVIEKVREKADIVEIAEEFTKLTKVGDRYKGLCPLHSEKTPSFYVDPLNKLFYCFGCKEGGDLFSLYMKVTNLTFGDTIKLLAKRYGIPIRGNTESSDDTLKVLETAEKLYREALLRNSYAISFLKKRKITEEAVILFGIGYSPSDDSIANFLRNRYTTDELKRSGIFTGNLRDRFRGRIVFPIRSSFGRVVAFAGRVLDNSSPKYLNSPETRFFKKSEILYGLFEQRKEIKSTTKAILVEGYMDVIGLYCSGIKGAVASMGTAFTTKQAAMLSKFTDTVVIAFDGDSAGERAFVKSLPVLLEHGLKVYKVNVPSGEDPDSLRKRLDEEQLKSLFDNAEDAVKVYFYSLIKNTTDFLERLKVINPIKDLLKVIKSQEDSFLYANLAADITSLPISYFLLDGNSDVAVYINDSNVYRLEERFIQIVWEYINKDLDIDLTSLPPVDAFKGSVTRNLYDKILNLLVDNRAYNEFYQNLSEGELSLLARLDVIGDEYKSNYKSFEICRKMLWKRYLDDRRRELIDLIRDAEIRGNRDEIIALQAVKRELDRKRFLL